MREHDFGHTLIFGLGLMLLHLDTIERRKKKKKKKNPPFFSFSDVSQKFTSAVVQTRLAWVNRRSDFCSELLRTRVALVFNFCSVLLVISCHDKSLAFPLVWSKNHQNGRGDRAHCVVLRFSRMPSEKKTWQ